MQIFYEIALFCGKKYVDHSPSNDWNLRLNESLKHLMPDLLTNGKASYTLNQATPPLVTVCQSEPHLWSTLAQTSGFDQCHPVLKWMAMTVVLSLEHRGTPGGGKTMWMIGGKCTQGKKCTRHMRISSQSNKYLHVVKALPAIVVVLKKVGREAAGVIFNDYWKPNYYKHFLHVFTYNNM